MNNQINKCEVSIILPVYNGSKTLSESIKSVLAQDFKDWELIILNDFSKDDSEKTILEFEKIDKRIVYLKNEKNIGLQKTLNKGIRISKGKYIARIDQDDTWTGTSKLSRQIKFLEQNPDYILTGTDATICNTRGEIIGKYSMPKSDKEIREKILSKNCFLHSSIVAKKEYMEKAGLYGEDSNSFCIEDYELWLRLGTIGKLENMDFLGLSIMIHTESITAKNRIRQAWKILNIIPKYRKTYGNFIKCYIISFCRLSFFTFISLIPFDIKSLIYKIQTKYK
jgi:glycosyltransferase involved in cell wall biosynthesis